MSPCVSRIQYAHACESTQTHTHTPLQVDKWDVRVTRRRWWHGAGGKVNSGEKQAVFHRLVALYMERLKGGSIHADRHRCIKPDCPWLRHTVCQCYYLKSNIISTGGEHCCLTARRSWGWILWAFCEELACSLWALQLPPKVQRHPCLG